MARADVTGVFVQQAGGPLPEAPAFLPHRRVLLRRVFCHRNRPGRSGDWSGQRQLQPNTRYR